MDRRLLANNAVSAVKTIKTFGPLREERAAVQG